MKDDDSRPARSASDERAERLAQALRDNLHRRKAQARAVRDEPSEDPKEAQ